MLNKHFSKHTGKMNVALVDIPASGDDVVLGINPSTWDRHSSSALWVHLTYCIPNHPCKDSTVSQRTTATRLVVATVPN